MKYIKKKIVGNRETDLVLVKIYLTKQKYKNLKLWLISQVLFSLQSVIGWKVTEWETKVKTVYVKFRNNDALIMFVLLLLPFDINMPYTLPLTTGQMG